VAFAVAAFLRTQQDSILLLQWIPHIEPTANVGLRAEYFLFLLISLLLWITAMRYSGVYRSHRMEQLSAIVRIYLQTAILCGLGTGFTGFALKLGTISRLFVLYFFSLAFFLLVGKQLSIISVLRAFRRKGYNVKRVIVIGLGEQVVRFAEKVEQEPGTGYRIVQIISDEQIDARGDGHLLPAHALHMLSDEVDEVFFVLGGARVGNAVELLAQVLLKHGKRVHIVPHLSDMRFFRQRITKFAGLPVLSLGGAGLDAVEALGKRILDVVGGAVLLVLLSPLFVVVTAFVKLTSPGPVFFLQQRLGKEGKRFHLYKFRTMRADAEEILCSTPYLYEKYVANNYKLPESEDPRITPVGRFLRKTSLDELPQLLNVLKGDMSLVGPRPIVPPEVEKYGDYAPLFLSVKPGLTGTWQVNGRSKVDYPLRVEMDLEYIRDQSLKTDVAILLKTLPAVLRQKGAH
jgi:exopolysaccharide biosynthesis polyprenyl glycosylphosphotransferase